MSERLIDFDPGDYLDSNEAIAEYLTAILEHGDPELTLKALGDVAKARGMTQIARETGLGRESLYKAFRPGAQPRFDTVMKVMQALGVRITATPAEHDS